MPKYGFEIANVSLKNKLCDKRKQICEKIEIIAKPKTNGIWN